MWWFWRASAAVAALSLMTVGGIAYLFVNRAISWEVLFGGFALLVVAVPFAVFGVILGAKYLMPVWTISRGVWRIARVARRDLALARNWWVRSRWETTRRPSALS
jgi:hypothetical protein